MYAGDAEEDIQSIGIVAVNLQLRELRLRTAGDQRVERYREKVAAKGEDLIVKNLESVQRG